MMKVEWSNFAVEDLDDIVRYIRRDSAFYAQAFGKRVVLASRRLKEFPESGRWIPEAEDGTLREIVVQGYRIMYRLQPQRVLILAVMHGSRNLSNPDNQPWQSNESPAD